VYGLITQLVDFLLQNKVINMKNKKISFYMIIIGFLTLLTNTYFYITPVTPQTRFIQRFSESEARVIFVIAGLLIVVGIVGIIKYKR